MCLGDEVDRHAIGQQQEVGAVIAVEAADEVLEGLAAALMLDDQQSRHVVHHLLGRRMRSQQVVAAIDFARGCSGHGFARGGHDDLVDAVKAALVWVELFGAVCPRAHRKEQ